MIIIVIVLPLHQQQPVFRPEPFIQQRGIQVVVVQLVCKALAGATGGEGGAAAAVARGGILVLGFINWAAVE